MKKRWKMSGLVVHRDGRRVVSEKAKKEVTRANANARSEGKLQMSYKCQLVRDYCTE